MMRKNKMEKGNVLKCLKINNVARYSDILICKYGYSCQYVIVECYFFVNLLSSYRNSISDLLALCWNRIALSLEPHRDTSERAIAQNTLNRDRKHGV